MVTDADLGATLRSAFGYSSFRPLQEDIVQAILGGQDVFVLMPTGGGKSLCYQLPALLLDGMTVVVSPLIALMKDQVDALQALGIAATYINSSLAPGEIGRRQAAMVRQEVKLLYVAPERLVLPGFLQLLQTVPVGCFAIDEAHCISEWGHDFRPEYRELRRLREIFPSTPLGAFTATATSRVQADIEAQLGLQHAARFQGSFNRPNLFYEVRPKHGADRELVAYLAARPDASGIVYCLARAETDRVAAMLRAHAVSAESYHAGLPADERKRRQEAFVRDDTRIIVATIAFGMGIDKPDVRFVVHYDVPRNLEGYYQESGRAGRDGEPSDCIVFYSYADISRHEYFIKQKSSETEQMAARQQLRRMADWAEATDCRRRVLLGYFDELFDGQSDPCCDVCRDPRPQEDCTIPAQMLLSCVKRTGERFGIAYVIDVLRGSRDERITRLGHDQLSTYGIGRGQPRAEWQRLARQLLHADYIRQEGEYNVVKVTERGHAALFRGERVTLAAPRGAPPRRADTALPEPSAVNAALFERLRALRKRLADERSVPPYVIFHDRVLRQMAAELPTTPAELRRIPGVGERKALDFGDVFLVEIADYAAQSGGRLDASPPPETRPVRTGLAPTARRTWTLFDQGRTPAEIAAERGLALSTIQNHLARAMEAGERVDLARLVAPEKQRAIEVAVAALGHQPLLKPVMEQLGEGFTYGEIRFVRAARRADAGRPP